MRKETEDPFDAKFKKSMSWANGENSKYSEPLKTIPPHYEEGQGKKSKKSKKDKKQKKSKKKRKRRRSSSSQSSSEVSSFTNNHCNGQSGLTQYVAPPSMDELRARKQKREDREKLKTYESLLWDV